MGSKKANPLAEKGEEMIQIRKTGGKEAYKNTIFFSCYKPLFFS
jgi:hypothetical protein